jgi:O-antigen ligase
MIDDLFMQRIGAVIFLTLSLFIISNVQHGVNTVRWVILICVLLAVINNLYEIFHPFSFVPPGYEFSRMERAAGFYINPNQSGAALVLGLIFSVGLVPKIYRVPYTILTLLGVLLTFSRAAILGWFVVVAFMVKQKTLRGKDCLIGLVFITATGLMLTPLLIDYIEVERGLSLVDVHERIGWFGSLGEISVDASQEERLVLARRSWDLFVNHPFIGSGMGSTERWSERTSTHNMYLYFMADYGIIGAFFLPLLVLSATCLARGRARRIAIPFSIFVLFWGFFSHNIVGEYYFLLSFALMAMVSAKSPM